MNMEFERAGLQAIPHNKWLNMKKWAQAVSPCANSLDQMLDLYKIDRSAREKHHGALIDAKLTAKSIKKWHLFSGHPLKKRNLFDIHVNNMET